MKTVFLILLLIYGISSADSQAVSNPQKSEAKKTQPSAGTPENPIFVKREKTQDEKDGDSEQEKREIKNLQIQAESLNVSKKSLIASEGALVETARAANAAVWATGIAGVAAAFALAAAIIAFLQWKMFAKQLFLMRASNKVSMKAAVASRKAAEASIESNNIAKQRAISEDRPWISIDAKIANNLFFDEKHGEGEAAGKRWHIKLAYELKHLGKTPATNVSVSANVIPFMKGKLPQSAIAGQPIFGGTDALLEFDATCSLQEMLVSANVGWGEVMFPGEKFNRRIQVVGNPARFEEAKKMRESYFKQFLIVICVTYGSTLDKSHYRTCKGYRLSSSRPGNLIALDGETIAAPYLELTLHPHKGSQAT